MAQIIRAGTREELAEFLMGRHPSTANVFQHFTYSHLPAHLAAASAPICGVAAQMVDLLPDGPELTAGLRKLLEAKDCMVRAMVELHRSIDDAPVEVVDDPLLLKGRILTEEDVECEEADLNVSPENVAAALTGRPV